MTDLIDDPVVAAAAQKYCDGQRLKDRKGQLITRPHPYDPAGVDIVADGEHVAAQMDAFVGTILTGNYTRSSRNSRAVIAERHAGPATINVGGKYLSEPVREFLFPEGYELVWQSTNGQTGVTIASTGADGLRVTFCRQRNTKIWVLNQVRRPGAAKARNGQRVGATHEAFGSVD